VAVRLRSLAALRCDVIGSVPLTNTSPNISSNKHRYILRGEALNINIIIKYSPVLYAPTVSIGGQFFLIRPEEATLIRQQPLAPPTIYFSLLRLPVDY
jgi:hypothetical protein